MAKRLRSWARTLAKLALLVLGYFWAGAAYKVVYAQTHDLTRFTRRIPISYYQQQFLIDSLLHQTWIFGPAFRQYIGELPSLGALVGSNPQAVLADYCRGRELQLSSFPSRYPYSVFCEEALDDAFLYSQGASFLGVFGAREQPAYGLAVRDFDGSWRSVGLPDFSRSTEVARRLADGYPDSSEAPAALLRVAAQEAQDGQTGRSRTTLRRVTLEYPRSSQAEEAANQLSRMARAAGQAEEAREYKRRALRAAERLARERFAGKALPVAPTITILGYRVDLSGLELQLGRVVPARDYLALAASEAERLKALSGLDERTRDDLGRTRERMEESRSELWVADLFSALKVGLPGPPPRPQEHPVSGRVLLEDRPLPGAEVLLSSQRVGRGPEVFTFIQTAPYRAVTDARGEYRVPSVPSGRYFVTVRYAMRPEAAGGVPVVPVGAAAERPKSRDVPPEGITVEERPLQLPPLRFQRALSTRSFGELPLVGKSLRVEWDPWPGADAYRVEVLAAGEMWRAFQNRVPREQRDTFRRRPVLWQTRVKGKTTAECPLEHLATDQPAFVQAAQYEYVVTALDPSGRETGASARALGRFHLSQQARNVLMEMKPPVRGARPGGRGRGRFWPRGRRQQ
jgi:hypothetical protein